MHSSVILNRGFLIRFMKILVITYNYGDSASGIISRRIAEELTAQGEQVKVICRDAVSIPDSPVEIDRVESLFSRNSFADRILGRIKRCGKAYFYDWMWVRAAIRYGSKLCREWQPDIIYCRTSPEEACYVGDALKQIFGIKLVQHFSDPIPAPLGYEPQSRRRIVLAGKMSNIVKAADIVSYGNEAMRDYALTQIGYDFSHKSIISPDAGACGEMRTVEFGNEENIVLTYLGNIYGSRNPQPLFDAIASLNKQGLNVKLDIYAPQPANMTQCNNFVEYKGRTSDVWSALEQSDILVDLDGDDDIPVFISSKLKDYILINRPILSITPAGSPSDRLLQGVESAQTTRNQAAAIESAIKTILTGKYKICKYDDRTQLIELFDPKAIAQNLITTFKSITQR